MAPRILVTNWVHPEVIERLARHGDVDANATRVPWPRETVLARAATADAVLAFMTDRIDAGFLAASPRLRIAACALKGYDNFDVGVCTARGVWVTIVPDLLTAPTAELAVGLAIALGRRIREGDGWVRAGRFDGWRPQFYGSGLDGSTVGVLGMGAVGQAIARRLLGFGPRVLYTDPRPLPAGHALAGALTAVPWEALLAESDVMILAAPLTPESFHRVDAAALARLKPGCRLVNAGRGSVVDEAAVADCLAAGRLGGYAADVFEMEDWARADRPRVIPPALLADPRTLFTPHLGSAVDEVRRAIALSAADDIVDLLEGRAPRNAINRPAGAQLPG